MGSRLHCYWFTIHHHKYTESDITEGGRDSVERMMKRSATDENTAQWRRCNVKFKLSISCKYSLQVVEMGGTPTLHVLC